MKKINQFTNHQHLALICCLFLMMLSSVNSFYAQNVQHQENTVDKSFRSDLKVDPITLGMSLNIPLGIFYGRNGMNIPITISYNSKLWEMEYGGHVQEGPCCEPSAWARVQGLPTDNNYSWVWTRYADKTEAGWSLRSIYPEETGDALELYDFDGIPSSIEDPEATFYVDQVRLRMPDGSTHEFRKDDKVYHLRFNPQTYPRTYYSVDGSRMKYVKESDSVATLFFPDGSRFVWGTNKGYYDKHGNKITSTDTLGRPVMVPGLAGQRVWDQVLSLPGLNNTSRNYILRWKYLKNEQTGETVLSNPNQQLHYIADTNPSGTYPDPNITPVLFQSGGGTRATPAAKFNPIVLAEVELPDKSKYKFRYNVYGEIDKIIYPTGSYERFEYGEIPNIDPLNDPYTQTNRGVQKRWVSESGTENDEILTQYSVNYVNTYTTITVNPDNTRTERVIKKGKGPGEIKWGFNDASAGSIIEERFYSATNQMLKRTINSYIMEGARGAGAEPTASRDARLEKQISISVDPGSNVALMTLTANEYDFHPELDYFAYLNVKRVKEYGFVSVNKAVAENLSNGFSTFVQYFNSQLPVRIMETDYLYDPNYKVRNLTSLPLETRILDGHNNVVAKSQTVYDESSYLEGALIQNAPGWENPNTTVRGLTTTVRKWSDVAANKYIETHALYNQFGNVRKTWDGRGNFSEIQYGDNYTDGINRNSFALPTKNISFSGSNGAGTVLETTIKYDFNTGLSRFTTDANKQTAETQYENLLLRPTKVIAPDGGQTDTEYGVPNESGQLSADQRFIKVKTQIDQNNWKVGNIWFDGLARTIKTQNFDPQGDVFVETVYDNMGRARKVTNPYRAGQSILWSENFYDDLSRVTKVKTPDGAEIITAYRHNLVQVTDQDKKSRRSESDALGKLTSVVEFTRRLANPTIVEEPTGDDFVTNYKYDLLGNLRMVDQGGQRRFFAYDALSRLVRAKLPEQENLDPDQYFTPLSDVTSGITNDRWSTAYAYDDNGNLIRRKDARNITTKYDYDGLNRNVKIVYEGETGTQTPGVDILYDTAIRGKGRLRATVTTGVSATSIDEYDEMGRVKNQRQNFWINNAWGTSYVIKPTYDLAGNVLTLTYPSGRSVSYRYDSAGRLGDSDGEPAFKGNLGGQQRTYASAILYDAFGGTNQERFGTEIPVYSKSFYNERGQLAEIRVGTTAFPDGGWNRGAILNFYSLVNGWTGSGRDNNGNLLKQIVYVPHGDSQTNGWTDFAQHYSYDQLNRITSVEEKINNNSVVNFRQVYEYDRWGNRKINSNLTSNNVNKQQFDVNIQNNRLGVPASNTGLMLYDKAGNLTTDTYTGSGDRTYDAENRMTGARLTFGQSASYTYDGAGKRIKRNATTVEGEIWQVYGVGGELLAEYVPNSSPTQPKKEYGYRGGELLITAEGGSPSATGGSAPTATGANLGFESPVVGGGGYKYVPTGGAWTFAGASGVSGNHSAFTYGNPLAPEGAQVAFLQGGSTTQISQTFSGFQVGASYKITFKTAQRGNTNQPGQDFDVYIGSQHLGTFRPSGTGYAEISTTSFTANATGNTLKFVGRNSSGGDNTAFIDDVRVVSAPASSEQKLTPTQVSASSTYGNNSPNNVADGNTATAWLSNGYPAQWIQLDLGRLSNLSKVRLLVSQDPAGQTAHNIYGGATPDQMALLKTVSNHTQSGQWIDAIVSVNNVRYLKIVTTQSPSWVSWREIEAYGSQSAGTSSPVATGVRWLVTDQLGTPRMTIDQTGSLQGVTRHDYLPFGEEISHLRANLFPGLELKRGYVADNVRQQFTSYERDSETGLDYAQARYYANVQGRFTSIDPLLASGRQGNPQSWNRYSYVGNNPLVRVDPAGTDWWYKAGRKTQDGRTIAIPEYHPRDPRGDYRRVSAEGGPGYVYQSDRSNHWWALNPNGPQALSFDTREAAEAQYLKFIGKGSVAECGTLQATLGEREFAAGFSTGLGGIFTSYLQNRSYEAMGLDTTSRDFTLGEALGTAASGGGGALTSLLSRGGGRITTSAGDKVFVVGLRADTNLYHSMPGAETINVPDAAWTPTYNTARIQAAIDANQTFYLASPVHGIGPHVTGAEMRQLYDNGYEHVIFGFYGKTQP